MEPIYWLLIFQYKNFTFSRRHNWVKRQLQGFDNISRICNQDHSIGAYVQVTIKNPPGPTTVSAQAKTWPQDHKLRKFLSQNFKLV